MKVSPLAVSLVALSIGCSGAGHAEDATNFTRDANQAVLDALPFETDGVDYDWANRGFIAHRDDPQIKTADGRLVWDLTATDFLSGPAPETANPSLWRNAELMAISGLFESAEGVYQVRGFDLANVTFVRGETGWIVIDPLTSEETALAAFELLKSQVEDLPVTAIVYSHSHGDHFGGSGAITDFAIDGAPIIAPAGFLEETISENIIAGPAMRRRAMFHVGDALALSPEEKIGTGLGVGLAVGTHSMVPPNTLIHETGESLTVDGVRMEFQITSGTEAPAEFNIGFPDLGVVNIAENANPTQHNILTPRGAKVRDARAWAHSLSESIDLFDYADVLVVSHGWPVFGNDEIATYLSNQRDAYAYLHDQTVRMMNLGMTMNEIAAEISLPDSIANHWYNRPYYGELSFNARAVYQFYLGFYDGNPVHLEPMPPETAAEKYVAAMGGRDAVLSMAQSSFESGDYQWASELLDRLVFDNASDTEAKNLLADTYEQMGWQSENALWRNFYLTGARELRHGVTALSRDGQVQSVDILQAIPSSDMFDVLATQLNPDRAGTNELRLGVVFPDRDEAYTIEVRNGVMTHRDYLVDEAFDATLTADRLDFLLGVSSVEPLPLKIASGEVKIEGNPMAFAQLTGWLDRPDPVFSIVTP